MFGEKHTRIFSTNAVILLLLFNSWNVPYRLMIIDPSTYCILHCVWLPTASSSVLYALTHASHTKPGLFFNEPGPQGEKNNYLFRHHGEESLIYPYFSMFVFILWLHIVCVYFYFAVCCPKPCSFLCRAEETNGGWHSRLGGRLRGPITPLVFPKFSVSFQLFLP